MKHVGMIAVVLVTVLLVASCAGGAEEERDDSPAAQAGAPSWYLNPPVADDGIYGVGSAKMSTLDTSRRMAVSRAREDIAFQMNASIEAAIIDYAQEAGADGNNQVISFVENISRQVTETTLQGSQTEQVTQAPDGTIYALVSYPKDGFVEAASDAFQRNEDAAFAEFKAQQALEYLDRQVEDNPSRAGSNQ
ncbi:MAG: LPP20 family lipoprotein [Spirochaetaceae bacterium]